MRALLILAGLFLATPALAQETQEINEWILSKSPERCTVGTNSGDTVIAFTVEKGGVSTVRLVNGAWTLDPSKTYPAQLSFAEADTQDKFTLRVAQSANGQRVLMGPMPEKTPEYFKASDMFSMEIEGIDEFISANITDGPKIWAAMQACVTQLH